MPERLEGQETPKVPERAAEQAEFRVEGAEAVEQAVEDAAGSVEAKAAELASVDAKNIMTPGDVPAGDLAGDAAFAEAQKEMNVVQDEARGLVGRTKDKLSGVLAKLKRYGRAAAAAGVIAGAAFPASEAAAHEPGPKAKIEHVEKGESAPKWNDVIAATERAVMNDADLLQERGEAGRREFMDAIKSWDQEKARADAAAIAGVDLSKVSRDGYKKVEVWSEKNFRARQNREFPPLPDGMDAQADNDEIRFRPSRFLESDGSVDKGKVHKGATHEFLHVMTTVENAEGGQDRLWDKAGVPHELNEGVTELFALRVAQKEGITIENHQAYAGGNLVAARLIEGLVGQKALYADFLEGKADRIKGALDAKLGKGAADRMFAKRLDVGQEGETLALVMEMAKSGVDVEKLWGEAKAEGFLDDVNISPDGKAVTISRDIEGKGVLVNSLVDEGQSVSPDMPVMRVFASTLKEGMAFTPENVAKAARGVQRVTEIADGTRGALKAQLDGLAEEYRQAERAGDTEKMKQLDPPEAMSGIYDAVLPDQIAEAKKAAIARGEYVADPNVFFNTRVAMAELQKAYEIAATPDAKVAARAAIESANETAARDAAKQIRLENLTPPIPEKK